MTDKHYFAILSAHFGRVEIEEEQVLHFVQCLPPFSGLLRYLILSRPEEAPFGWLQSTEEPALALVVGPYEEVTGVAAPVLPADIAIELGLSPDETPACHAILSVSANPAETTVNLLAPIYVNCRTLRARQVILNGDLSLTRVPLLPQAQVA